MPTPAEGPGDGTAPDGLETALVAPPDPGIFLMLEYCDLGMNLLMSYVPPCGGSYHDLR